jgi:hypothetical protein
MCRNLISVGWDGRIFDCDFNQMLDLPLRNRDGTPMMIKTAALTEVENATIAIDDHCYACTAGAGSSCGGALVQ